MGNKDIANYLGIGERIKSYRTSKGISQKDFAKILNIPVSSLSNYENENRAPSFDMLEKIAEALGVSVPNLLFDLDAEYEHFLKTEDSLEGIVSMLSLIYGNCERVVKPKTGEEFYVVGTKRQGQFVLRGEDLTYILEVLRGVIPPVVDKIKDSRDISEVVESASDYHIIIGQAEAVKRVEELTEIPRYQKDSSED